jgi:hypothetical protein
MFEDTIPQGVQTHGCAQCEKKDVEIAALKAALQSIVDNTCCEGCQEAARVAKQALGQGGK